MSSGRGSRSQAKKNEKSNFSKYLFTEIVIVIAAFFVTWSLWNLFNLTGLQENIVVIGIILAISLTVIIIMIAFSRRVTNGNCR